MRHIYFISDTHFGGDGELKAVDTLAEFEELLKTASATNGNELIIAGDSFGMWEFTKIEGPQKLDAIIKQQPALMRLFKKYGAKLKITIVPGNHDYELACYPEFVKILASYNIHLEQKPSLSRKLGKHKIWVEHGHQHDSANAVPDFGDPYALPLGYFITAGIVGVAGTNSNFGRGDWLKDIQAVCPSSDIPAWVLSNYFYKEMARWLRLVILPFILLIGFSLALYGLEFLRETGVIDQNYLIDNIVVQRIWPLKDLLELVAWVDLFFIVIALLCSVPVYFIIKDIRKAVSRYRFDKIAHALRATARSYNQVAKRLFKQDPAYSIYLYGHTHEPSYRKFGKRLVLNTGTWLKRFKKIQPRVGLMQPVYYPYYCLNYYCVWLDDKKKLHIEYRIIPKHVEDTRLSITQKLLVLGRTKRVPEPIPPLTVL